MRNTESPLSPHLTIYRWPTTMIVSILHRATGVAMTVALLMLAWWLLSVASGAAQYELFYELMSSAIGRLLWVAWSFAFFLHLANGVRHLFWDFGHGFEKSQADFSAWFVLLFALAATAAFWLIK